MNVSQTLKEFHAALRVNPRLRWGLLGIVGILWLYGVLELRDEVQGKKESYALLSKKLARIQGSVSQSEWLDRLKEAQSLQLALESRLWREGTIGLAQATVNDWLTQLAQQTSLNKVQLQVAAQEEMAGRDKEGAGSGNDGTQAAAGLWKVSAKLAFDFSPQSFYQLLSRMSLNEKKVVVESLAIHSTPTPKVELLLAAYFPKPESSTDHSETKQNGR